MGCGSSSAAATAVPIVPTAGATPAAAPSSSPAATASSPTPQGGASPKPDAVRLMSRPHTVVGSARGGELRQYDGKLCVLVSDMSGFTKQTRQHGIIHFGSKILRMRQIFHPIILRHAPLVVETEADNFLVIFDNVVDGIKCASDMMSCSKAYNRRVKDKKMRIEFGGIGLDYGEVTLENPSGTMYGMAADGAFVLGEDVSDGDILCTHRVRKELKTNYKEIYETFKMERKEDKELPFSHLEGHYFICKERPSKKPNTYGKLDRVLSKKEEAEEKKKEKDRQHQLWSVFWSDWMDASFIGESSTLLTKRHQFDLDDAEIQVYDDEIKQKYMGQAQVVVLMFGLKTGLITEKYGIPHTFKLKQLILALFEPIIESHGGRAIEDFLLVFEFGYEAVACALEMAHALAEYNRVSPENEQVQAKGFGVHSGPLLIVPGTNVHWGDAVSTASKLGEDLGNGRILVSDKVWSNVQQMPQFSTGSVVVQIEKLNTSNVDFEAANLSGMYDKSQPFPQVEHHFQSSFDPNATLEREALKLREERAKSIADKTEAADSVPVPIRQVSLGDGPHRMLTMFDLKRNRRNSDRGSVFKLPQGAGAVEVTAGLMGDTLGRKLLKGTGGAPAQEDLEAAPTTRSEHREIRERRGSKSRSRSGKHDKHEMADPTAAAAAAASPGGTNRLPPWSKDKGAVSSSQMMSSPAARMGARRLSNTQPQEEANGASSVPVSPPVEAKEDAAEKQEKKETEKEKKERKEREKREKKEKKEKKKEEKKEKKREKKAAAAAAADPVSPDVPSASPISSDDAPVSADLKTPEPAEAVESKSNEDEKLKELARAMEKEKEKEKEKERAEAEKKAAAEEAERKAKAAEAEAKAAESEKKAKADESEKEKARAEEKEKEKEKEKQRKAAAEQEAEKARAAEAGAAAASAEAEKKKQKEEADKKKALQEEEAKRAKEEAAAAEKEKQQKAKAEADAAPAKQKAEAEASKPAAAPRTVIKLPPAKAPLPPIAASVAAPPAAAAAAPAKAPTVRKVAVNVAKKKVESESSSSSDSSSDESDSDSDSGSSGSDSSDSD